MLELIERAPSAIATTCRERSAQIPENEISDLALRLADARDWAAQGKPRLGYAVLLRGFIHAERCVLEGEPWADALVLCWRDAIGDYCERYDPQQDE
jgi:hypothetical protein